MNSVATRLLLLTLLTLAAPSCYRRADESPPAASEFSAASTGFMRNTAFTVTFDKYTDTIYMDFGVKMEQENGKTSCFFVAPYAWKDGGERDDYTRAEWDLLNIYWLIFDREDQVDRTKLTDVFFAGDRVLPEQFYPYREKTPLGFLYLTQQHRNQLSLSDVWVNRTRTKLTAELGAPIHAQVRVTVEAAADRCAIRTDYCKSADNCAAEENFAKLKNIHISQNFFHYPTDVTFE